MLRWVIDGLVLFSAHLDKLRRSMPNLVRAPSMPSVPIPTNPSASSRLLRYSQSFDSSSGLARLQSSSKTPVLFLICHRCPERLLIFLFLPDDLVPPPGQLQNRVQSVGNFTSLSRQPLKATAYVSPTIKGPASANLQGASSSIPLLGKQTAGGVLASAPTTPRSSLPRPASFVGTISSTPRSKATQSARR